MDTLEDVILSLSRVIGNLNDVMNLLSKENDILIELIIEKTSDKIMEKNTSNGQTYFS